MSLSSAVLWWEEWQLRILVLASIFIQYVLFFSIWMRRAPILRRLRVLVWVAYTAGDAVAIYALATLFNRRNQTSDGESSALEVLWAPILLIHLGGQTCISAYSLEDNELWKRHTITLVSQVTVALYVFCKWWSGGKMLLAAAILLFVIGILKFAQKPWALRTASFNSLQASSTVFLLPEAQRERRIYTLEEYVQAAKYCVLETKIDSQHEYESQCDYMFIDLSAPYSFRIAELPSFLMLVDKRAYRDLQCSLGNAFDILYTRITSGQTTLGVASVLLLPFLALASAVLFATSHKDGLNEKDITVTYILFGCSTMLEFLFPFIAISSLFPFGARLFGEYISGWHDMVSQYNVISFSVRKKKPTFLMKLATFSFLREFINQHWYIQHVPIAFQVTGVVRQHIVDGWKKYIHDAASYKRFSELRGQWALRRHHQLGWSLNKPFDESVLIWHIATDLCFYHPNTSPQGRQGEATQHSREISNYMIYLLLIRPEMLMPGTRSDLFTLASDIIVENSKGSLDMTEENLAKEILNMSMLPSAVDMVSNALKLSKALMELGDEQERWTVIQGVWMEMLCYSASRCRGYLHAKSLGDGGEFLSIIWLLLSVMGMETLADRHQRSELPQEEATAEQEAAASTSHSGRADQSEDNISLV
ncbi:uncharacterized protein LOC124654403 [Lolium rigidum]|uniref:uncharacterized protein LOC124654403 n=1 Tax=Lolium rigidum TaxID=89674 RepID=UPI001F5CB097|nr:uncharacterized protein LOC124654403 [Lolium rigidum]